MGRFMTFCITVSHERCDGAFLIGRGAGKDTQDAVRELMELPPSRELELPPTAGGPARQLLRKLGL
jgi:hypothetical protein